MLGRLRSKFQLHQVWKISVYKRFATDQESHEHSLFCLQDLAQYTSFMESIGNVLDIGCGTGQLSLFLARGNREVYGVDISNGSLLTGEKFRSENNIDNAYFMKMDVFDLKFKKNLFGRDLSLV